jgi:hypothetical protein
MLCIVINVLLRYRLLKRLPKRRSRIQVSIVLREVAGTDLQPDTMPDFEDL